MDALRKPPVRKLNPGMLQSDDEVREQFVVRQHEFASVLEVLRGNIEASSCQHVLVVAPRGRGKTMLLARVAAELHTDAVLSEGLLPVRFMEESQEVFNLADFWLETLFHLARESAVHGPEVAREVRETHADLEHFRIELHSARLLVILPAPSAIASTGDDPSWQPLSPPTFGFVSSGRSKAASRARPRPAGLA